MKKLILILIPTLALIGFFNYRIEIKKLWVDITKPDIPEEVKYQPAEEKIQDKEIEKINNKSITEIPKSYNLDVPFTSQAPLADWQMPFKEACEEASILMVDYYYRNKEFTPQLATEEIIQMVDWQEDYFGGHFDLTVEQTKEMVEKYFNYQKVKIIENPSVDDIKNHIIKQHPVIIPAAGRQLGNPYFRAPGPIYHMLVIKGYTENQFITNDPGTKRGENFLYNYNTIIEAIHDCNPEDISLGAKKILIIYP